MKFTLRFWELLVIRRFITDAQGRQFTFNGDNKQTQVKDSANNIIGTYSYDGDGKRIKKVTNSEKTTFVYSGGKLVAEYQQTTATPQTPVTNYITTDMLGSPRVISDGSGNIISRRDFMPFGEELNGIGNRSASNGYNADTVRQKFTGYQRDNETNLDFAEARYYNNAVGRFTAVDPLLASGKSANPQTFNRYVYVMNNPLLMSDPSGLMGDYYDRSGNYLGNDGIDNGRVYYADVTRRDGKTTYVNNVVETNWSQLKKDTIFGNYGGGAYNFLAGISNTFYDAVESPQYLQARYWGCFGGGACPEQIFPRTAYYQAGSEEGQTYANSMTMSLNFGMMLVGYPRASAPSFAGFTTKEATGPVTVFRVEGIANQRISTGSGGVTIQGDKMLFLNFGERSRAESYLATKILKGLEGAEIKSFQVNRGYLNSLRNSAVPESQRSLFPDSPIRVDFYDAPNQFGIPSSQFPTLKKNIIQ